MKWGVEITFMRIVLGRCSGVVKHWTGHSPKAAQGMFGHHSQGCTEWDCWGGWIQELDPWSLWIPSRCRYSIISRFLLNCPALLWHNADLRAANQELRLTWGRTLKINLYSCNQTIFFSGEQGTAPLCILLSIFNQGIVYFFLEETTWMWVMPLHQEISKKWRYVDNLR